MDLLARILTDDEFCVSRSYAGAGVDDSDDFQLLSQPEIFLYLFAQIFDNLYLFIQGKTCPVMIKIGFIIIIL